MNKEISTDANHAMLTLGITSKLSGIPSHSIRQYIEKGLLIPFKLDSKRHLFSINDVSRLKHIHYLIREKGLNFAGIRALFSMIPCWEVKKCSSKDRLKCEGYRSNSIPCWEASSKGVVCKNETCRECEVYSYLNHSADLKSVEVAAL